MKRVLVIDDDALLVRLIEHSLSQVGVEVLKAYGGYDGISLVRTQQPDLVILDIMMPKVHGIDVMKKLKEHEGGPGVIICTSKSYKTDLKL